MTESILTRQAKGKDLIPVLEIYNQGIGERIATFETRPRTVEEIEGWLNSGYPFVVTEYQGGVKAFAVTFPYSSRDCYRGVAEFSVYVKSDARDKGLGRATMSGLLNECEKDGFWKLVSRVFTENTPSRRMLTSLGFREVGIYEKHGKLDGKWRDTVIVEYIINKNID